MPEKIALDIADSLELTETLKPLDSKERAWARDLAALLSKKPERIDLVSFSSGLALVDREVIEAEDVDLSFCDEAYVLARFGLNVRGTVD